MRPVRSAAAAIVVSALLGGCGVVGTLARRVDVTQLPLDRAPLAEVGAPDARLAHVAAVARAEHSVVKIRSVADSCQKILEGSGFVVAPQRVLTNAHVVAGAGAFTVSVDGREHDATVVHFDPTADISMLDVPGLTAPVLNLDRYPAASGSDAVVLGYPGGGDFAAHPARIRDVIDLNGPDIYRTTTVNREVYVIKGKVGQGDSGGPLIAADGSVLGISFGAATDDPQTGFALTSAQMYASMLVGLQGAAPVPTGDCVV